MSAEEQLASIRERITRLEVLVMLNLALVAGPKLLAVLGLVR